jgi:transposase
MATPHTPKPIQSLSGYIRQHLAEIEAELEAGIYQEHLIKELEEAGFTVTVKSFRTLLYRARERASKNKASSTSVTRQQPKQEIKTTAAPPIALVNPLKKSVGFEYTGTQNVDPSDLI